MKNDFVKIYHGNATVFGPDGEFHVYYDGDKLDPWHPHPNYYESPFASVEEAEADYRECLAEQIADANIGLTDEQIEEAVDEIASAAHAMLYTWWQIAEEE